MTRSYERFAGACALLVATAGILFTITFAVVVRGRGPLGEVGKLGRFGGRRPARRAGLPCPQRHAAGAGGAVRPGGPVSWGSAGRPGRAAVHGAYDVAVLANPVAGSPDLPSQVDPRGVATFAAAGAALAVFGALILQPGDYPACSGRSAVLSAVLLLIVYFGPPDRPRPAQQRHQAVRRSVGCAGDAAFYLLLGRTLLRGPRTVVRRDAHGRPDRNATVPGTTWRRHRPPPRPSMRFTRAAPLRQAHPRTRPVCCSNAGAWSAGSTRSRRRRGSRTPRTSSPTGETMFEHLQDACSGQPR